VNGAAVVSVGPNGGALQRLGYTDQGVDISVNENKAPIFTDIFGPMTPQDFQDMGMTATIRVPLIAIDDDVFALIQNAGDINIPGLVNTPGLVLGLEGFAFSIGIASPFSDPWFFDAAVISPRYGTKLATKANPLVLEFLAWPFLGVTATTGSATELFARAFP
jgi:hypothetical protein